MTSPPAGPGAPPAGTIYQLRIVVAGISPLIWRRLEVPAGITVAGLHAIVQTIFGWSDEHLHRFTIAGVEYGIWQEGGPGFRDDAGQVHLAGLGLRERERFSYEYNFFAPWCAGLRVEQITGAQAGRAYPRCTGGRLLASGGSDKMVRLWNPATGAQLRTLTGHTDSVWVWDVAFSPDGRLLASGSDDGTVRLWDPVTGAQQCILTGHTGRVYGVAFSPDGRLLASCGDDGTVRLWDLAPADR